MLLILMFVKRFFFNIFVWLTKEMFSWDSVSFLIFLLFFVDESVKFIADLSYGVRFQVQFLEHNSKLEELSVCVFVKNENFSTSWLSFQICNFLFHKFVV